MLKASRRSIPSFSISRRRRWSLRTLAMESDHENLFVVERVGEQHRAVLRDRDQVFHVQPLLSYPAHPRLHRGHHARLVRDVLEGADHWPLMALQTDAVAVMGVRERQPVLLVQL